MSFRVASGYWSTSFWTSLLVELAGIVSSLCSLVHPERHRDRPARGGDNPLLSERADETGVRVLAVEEIQHLNVESRHAAAQHEAQIGGGVVGERVLVLLVEVLARHPAHAAVEARPRRGRPLEPTRRRAERDRVDLVAIERTTADGGR